ncbi:MAG: response regulator [Elusimicrobiota bacterium]
METTVLVVDDDQQIQDLLKMLLEKEHYRVETASDGEAALASARARPPDLILLDVLLPRVHGYEVCDRLRQDPATCLIPIIMVTSLTALKDRVTGIKLGADEYITKPFEPLELLARVERLLARARQNAAANPLTGLPGAADLEREIRVRLEGGDAFTLGLCDLTQLGRFNERAGYERGDKVIRLTGTILRSAVSELGSPGDPAVHLGGDDFGFITSTSRAGAVAARILENSASLIPLHYVDEKTGSPPEPRPAFYIRVGLADVPPRRYQHPAQALDRARAALAQAKQQGVPLSRIA